MVAAVGDQDAAIRADRQSVSADTRRRGVEDGRLVTIGREANDVALAAACDEEATVGRRSDCPDLARKSASSKQPCATVPGRRRASTGCRRCRGSRTHRRAARPPLRRRPRGRSPRRCFFALLGRGPWSRPAAGWEPTYRRQEPRGRRPAQGPRPETTRRRAPQLANRGPPARPGRPLQARREQPKAPDSRHEYPCTHDHCATTPRRSPLRGDDNQRSSSASTPRRAPMTPSLAGEPQPGLSCVRLQRGADGVVTQDSSRSLGFLTASRHAEGDLTGEHEIGEPTSRGRTP